MGWVTARAWWISSQRSDDMSGAYMQDYGDVGVVRSWDAAAISQSVDLSANLDEKDESGDSAL
jgi:hypothetical protein